MTGAGVSCGVLLPNFDPQRLGGPPQIVPAARLAEQLGFESLWAGDHLACPAPGLDAPTCITAAAVVTERIALGFSVMLLGLRNPAWTAKQLASIDLLAGGGRVRLGVGGGEMDHAEDRRRKRTAVVVLEIDRTHDVDRATGVQGGPEGGRRAHLRAGRAAGRFAGGDRRPDHRPTGRPCRPPADRQVTGT